MCCSFCAFTPIDEQPATALDFFKVQLLKGSLDRIHDGLPIGYGVHLFLLCADGTKFFHEVFQNDFVVIHGRGMSFHSLHLCFLFSGALHDLLDKSFTAIL